MTNDTLSANVQRLGGILQELGRQIRSDHHDNSLQQLQTIVCGLQAAEVVLEWLPRSGVHYVETFRFLQLCEIVLTREFPPIRDAIEVGKTETAGDLARRVVLRLDEVVGADLDRLAVEYIVHQPIRPISADDARDSEYKKAIDLRNQDPTLSWRKIRTAILDCDTDDSQARAFAEAVKRYARKNSQVLARGRQGAPKKEK